jgi:hypothetical protein
MGESFNMKFFMNPPTRERANPQLWMIKNMLSVERRSIGLACKRNKILWSSEPTTNMIVKMQITEHGVQSEDHITWRMRAQTR